MVDREDFHHAIPGVDSDGYLLPGADEFEVGFAIGGKRRDLYETRIEGRIADLFAHHGSRLGADELMQFAGDAARISHEVDKEIPFPKPRPMEGQLTLDDLLTEAAEAIPVNSQHHHYVQTMAGDLIKALVADGAVPSSKRSDAYFAIFGSLVDASDLGYRAKAIEPRD